MLKKTNHMD